MKWVTNHQISLNTTLPWMEKISIITLNITSHPTSILITHISILELAFVLSWLLFWFFSTFSLVAALLGGNIGCQDLQAIGKCILKFIMLCNYVFVKKCSKIPKIFYIFTNFSLDFSTFLMKYLLFRFVLPIYILPPKDQEPLHL